MKIDTKNMRKNLNITKGLFFSQRVMLDLTSKGLKREKAYKIVQKCAMKSIEKNRSFYDILCEELCGIGHFVMRGSVTVQSQEEFDAWLATQH